MIRERISVKGAEAKDLDQLFYWWQTSSAVILTYDLMFSVEGPTGARLALFSKARTAACPWVELHVFWADTAHFM